MHTITGESRLKFLIGRKWNARAIDHHDRRQAVQHCGLRASIAGQDSISGSLARYQSAVEAPVEAYPGASLPRQLILDMRGLVEGFVVVDAENAAGGQRIGPGSRQAAA